ncbi:PDZ domain-containing protein [Mucilaginibacter daejeonensis]|uniref:PDZ domain-containing protein n=1 Tax=Mucilaginibacter daejeonensis TaxID=398049 RepID=UPI001D170F70|nr:PDZ domain-containing protein [Mucilaginibacter daejeonensis]UEG53262.1 PDZ domain-containing protein [Mucilaginibacter daejeonensis]
MGQGLTGPLNGRIGRIGEIEVGKYRFKSVITSFLDTMPRPAFTVARDGNLGIGILKKFLMVFDYANNKLYLKPNYKFKEPFEHDMSGLEYYAAGNELKNIIVSRVEPGSAGADAGIKANDQITGINLRSVGQMTMTEIDNLFRSRDKRSLVVEVYRDGEYLTVILTLKRRV